MMNHQELLDKFFTGVYERELHRHMTGQGEYTVPVEEVKDFMTALTRIPLAEFLAYTDQHLLEAEIPTSDITQCGALSACTDELCRVLLDAASGLTAMEVGRSAVYEKYLRVPAPAAWTRYGNHQTKTARQLGLAFKNEKNWHLSCYGYVYVYPLLNVTEQKKFLARALLRNPFYAQILSKARFERVDVSTYMQGLSASTQGNRSGSVAKMLGLGLSEMDREGIKWYDIRVPKYNSRTKTLSSRILEGTRNALDRYGLNEEFFAGGVPLYTVKAACGYFVDHAVPELEGWMDLSESGVKTNSQDYFVVYAKGDSMLPQIKDGDLCLFKWYKGEPLYHDIVLTQCRDYDAEYESSYTIKCFNSQPATAEAPRQIYLEPLNRKKYKPILLSEEDGVDYQTIGLFVKVLEA